MNEKQYEQMKQDRTEVLLRAAYDLIKRSTESRFVEETTSISVFYDGANCDGYCLMDDIADVLGLDDGESPIPLEEE